LPEVILDAKSIYCPAISVFHISDFVKTSGIAAELFRLEDFQDGGCHYVGFHRKLFRQYRDTPALQFVSM